MGEKAEYSRALKRAVEIQREIFKLAPRAKRLVNELDNCYMTIALLAEDTLSDVMTTVWPLVEQQERDENGSV